MCVRSPKRSLDSSDNILAFLELYAYHWLDFAVFIHIFKPLTFRIILKFESAYDLHMYMYSKIAWTYLHHLLKLLF